MSEYAGPTFKATAILFGLVAIGTSIRSFANPIGAVTTFGILKPTTQPPITTTTNTIPHKKPEDSLDQDAFTALAQALGVRNASSGTLLATLAYTNKWFEAGVLLVNGALTVSFPDAYIVYKRGEKGDKDKAMGHAIGGVLMLGVGGGLMYLYQ